MKKLDLFFFALIVILVVLTRTVFHIAPNIEFVTAASILSGYLLSSKKYSLFVPLVIMLISDAILGNTRIFLFTWSGFLFPVFLGVLLKKADFNKLSPAKWLGLAVGSETAGIVGTLFFFVWTNFGHWLTTSMYSKDFTGLIQSYLNGLPFLRAQLGGNLIIVPVVVTAGIFAYQILKSRFDRYAVLQK